jgi:YHS domain-containing protein
MMAVSRKSNHASRAGRLVVSLCGAVVLLCTLDIPSKALIGAPIWTDPATGFAIGGFDPVSYFTDAQARIGTSKNEHVWSDIAWLFSNAGNLDAFKRNPEVYMPRFGGHGAYGAARGVWNQGNPRIWVIHGGRLYFFFSAQNREAWLRDPAAMIAEGELHWREKKD